MFAQGHLTKYLAIFYAFPQTLVIKIKQQLDTR